MKFIIDKENIGVGINWNRKLLSLNGFRITLLKPPNSPWYCWFIPYIIKGKKQVKK